MKRLAISLIDDDPTLGVTISKFLGVYNDVFINESLGGARENLGEKKFDVVLLDRALPDGSGLDFIPEVKRLQPFVPIIIMTADPDFNAVQKAIAAGADDYLIKSDQIIPDLMVRIPVAINSATTKKIAASVVFQAKLSVPASRGDVSAEKFEEFMKAAERAFISAALHYCNGSATTASELLGLARSTIFKKISDHKITQSRSIS